ncbi:nucleoside deaminase [Deinococcus ficus]|uniref:nucleoside deaminase n=1 Tax=Deinococcus ficus TaxID=317577 RepID=UPI0003B356EF|nr:deaminase [Deinococcus ficus]
MWSTFSIPWQASLEQAWQADVDGALPFGAALVRPGGEIVSIGRNRTQGAAYAATPVLTGHRLAHAELEALMHADLSAPEARTDELYTTQEPCPMCLGAVGRIVTSS